MGQRGPDEGRGGLRPFKGGPRDYKELLRRGRWFAGLSAPFQEALLHSATLRKLTADERLFSRGDEPCGLYAVLDGTIRVSGFSDEGKEALLTLLEPPTWFGEISMFDGQPRTHDATADVESLVLQVPQPQLAAFLDEHPAAWRELGLLAASKLRLAFIAMEESALLPIPQRVARRLQHMVEGYGERQLKRRAVEVSQDQLASMLAVSRQTVNHVLKELEQKGLIKLAYGSIEILDADGLRAIAAGS